MQNEPFWSVKWLCLQSEKALFENEESVKKRKYLVFSTLALFARIAYLRPSDFSFGNNATTEA